MTFRELLALPARFKEVDLDSELLVSVENEDGSSSLIHITEANETLAGSSLILNGKEELKLG